MVTRSANMTNVKKSTIHIVIQIKIDYDIDR